MPQFGSHLQTVIGQDESVTRCGGVAPEQVHIVAVHSHDQVPECSLIGDAGNSDLRPPDVIGVITGSKVQVVSAPVFCFNQGFKATTKIKTFKSGPCQALP